MNHLCKIIGIGLALVWGAVLLGFAALVLLFFPFKKNDIEWRRMCRWEEEE